MLIYVSGPMTGRPEWNYPAFREAALCLRENGHIVLNPAETAGGSTRLTRTQFLYIDVGYVQAADALVMLPGWENSKGALLELHIATALEKPAYDYSRLHGGLGSRVHVAEFLPVIGERQLNLPGIV